MLSRRGFIAGSGCSILNDELVRAEIACSPFQSNGVQFCQAGVVVNVPTSRQQRQNWCWAACIEAIFTLHGYAVDQDRIVQKVYGGQYDLPASGMQVAYAVNGFWTSDDGREFEAQAGVLWDTQYFFGQPDAVIQAAWELQAGNPLIVGALGHATVLTALSYFRDVMGRGSIAGITVRDPWPYRPNLRALSAQEALLTQFIAKIRVL